MLAIYSRFRSLLFGILFLVISLGSYAQRVTANVNVGNAPLAMAVNPVTNSIYVANQASNNVTVIDGSTNNTATINVGTGPRAIAVNPVTNKIYVANGAGGTVTVINGADNTTTPVTVGTTPCAIAVNSVTNKIYVTNLGSNTVTVINGADNTIAPAVNVGAAPRNIAVNPVTNKIYVTSQSSNTVTVIDGSSNGTTPVNIGATSFSIAVNPITNKVYVTNPGSGKVTVIDGSNNMTPVAVGTGPIAVAVNPVTNMAYIANNGSGTVTVIDGSNNTTPITTSTNPVAVAVNPVTNKIYVSNASSGKVTIIDGASNTTTQLNAGTNPGPIASNSVTNKVYVVNNGSNNVTVIDGATNNTAFVSGVAGSIVANPATNKIYVANGNIAVIDGTTNLTVNVPDPDRAFSVDVNPVTNKVYVGNQDSTVTVLDGASNTTTLVNAGSPGQIRVNPVVNPVTNKIYVVSALDTTGVVTVIDGASNTVTATLQLGGIPVHSALNTVTNKLYVATAEFGLHPPPGPLVVIDGATNNMTSVMLGGTPSAIAVNPVTNKIYTTNVDDSGILTWSETVIDGITYGTNTFSLACCPGATAVNPVTNRIYVANSSSGINSSTVTVMDGATNFSVSVPVDPNPTAIAVNPVTNKIYVVNTDNTVTVIDGTSNTTATLGVDPGPTALAINPVTNKIFVADSGFGDVAVITEQQVNAIPLTTAITPLAGNQTTLTQPTFTFTTASSYAPTAPPVQNVYYQVDTWQGPWLSASGVAPTFTGETPVLRLGTHILYAYAADGQTADSIQTGQQSAPNIGQITAYVFTVMPSASYAAVALISSSNPAPRGFAVTFTAMITGPNGSAPTGTVSFYDGSNQLSTSPLNGSQATFTTSSLAVGTRMITAIYSGDSTFYPSLSNALYEVIGRDLTNTVVTLTAGANPSVVGASLTFAATVTSPFPGIPTSGSGAVVFRDGNVVLGNGVATGPGVWTFTTAALAAGLHAITATYPGDANFLPSVSPVFTQVVESNAGGASTTTLTVNGSAGPVTVNFGVVQGVPPGGANFVVTVTGSTNGDSVVLLDGGLQLGPTLSLAAGKATYLTQLPIGQHNIQACYIGNGAASGSSSAVVSVNRSPRPRPR